MVPAGQVAADDANGRQLGDILGDGHQVAHHPEGLAAEVGIGPGEDHLHPTLGQMGGDFHDPGIEELRLVDGHDVDLGGIAGQPEDLVGTVYWRGFAGDAGMG